MRFSHILKSNKCSSIKYNWIFFDTETEKFKEDSDYEYHRLKVGYACYYRFDKVNPLRKEIFFNDGNTLLDFIESCYRKKSSLTIASHNIAFDIAATGLIFRMLERGYSIEKIFIELPVVVIKLRKDDYFVTIVDTFNYFKSSVKELGKSIALEKLNVDFNTVDIETLKEYCKRDTLIIAESMRSYVNFIKDNNLGSMGFTTPQQAFNTFRHRFMKHKIYLHNWSVVEKLEMQSYFGGRTECFFIGHWNKGFYKLDVNSMYPYVMKNNLFPVQVKGWKDRDVSINETYRLLTAYCVVARCELNTDVKAYPYRMKDKVIYPVGNFETVLTTQSLKYAIENDHVKNIKEIAWYDAEMIFLDYVDFFYTKRYEYKTQRNSVYADLCKLFLNSLYGKFGQKMTDVKVLSNDQIIMDTDYMQVAFDGEGCYNCYRIGDKIFCFRKCDEASFNAFPAIAAHVTDYARMYLWSLMNEAGLNNILYLDTDSLIVTKNGKQNLQHFINNDELGMLKVEEKGQWIKIKCLKEYSTEKSEKIKGISKTAKRISDDTFEQLEFPQISTVLHEKMDGIVKIRKVTKVLKRVYTKGQVSKSGWVKPLRL